MRKQLRLRGVRAILLALLLVVQGLLSATPVSADPPPTITLTPDTLTADYGPDTALAVTGTNTHFSGGAWVRILDSSNTDIGWPKTFTVIDDTHATLSLAPGLAVGSYTVQVNAGMMEQAQATLTVTPPPPPTITLTPDTLTADYGPDTALAISGTYTHFSPGNTWVTIRDSSNMSIGGTSLTVIDDTHATLSLAPGLAVGSYTVQVNAGMMEQAQATLTVVAPPPPTITLAPDTLTADYGPDTALAISGTYTHFSPGNTWVTIRDSSNTGIGGTSLTVTDATHATLGLAPGLAVGSYTVQLSTGMMEQAQATLTVTPPPPPTITLTPDTLMADYAPDTVLAISGTHTHFAAGYSSVRILDSSNMNMGWPTTLTVTDATHATLLLGAGLPVGSYTVQVNSGMMEQAQATLTVVAPPPPTITLAPDTLFADYAADTPLAISGTHTHFDPYAWVRIFDSSNMEIGWPKTFTVTDATHATLSLGAGLPVGSYTIQVVNSGMTEQVQATLTVVTPPPPTITLAPDTLTEDYAPDTALAITGTNTHFVADHTWATIRDSSNTYVGPPPTVTVTDATHATLTLAAGLPAGIYMVQLNTNGEQVQATLTVNPPPPPAITLTPNTLGTGYPDGLALTVIGTNTHFNAYTTLAILDSSNLDMKGTSTLTVTDATHATVNLMAGLPPGNYTLHLTGAGPDVSAPLTVTLTGPPPTFWPVCASPTSQNCIQAFTLNGAPAPDTLLLQVWNNDVVQMQVRYDPAHDGHGTDDLLAAGSPVSASSTIHVALNVGTQDPVTFTAVANITAYTYQLDPTNGNTISFDATPIASSVTMANCTPWACGDTTTQADFDFGGVVFGVLSNMYPPPGSTAEQVAAFEPFRTNVRGAWVAMNAQAFSLPSGDPATLAFCFDLAGPYLTQGGTMNNGFFKVFLPDSLLTEVWGFADPTSVTSSTLVVTRRDGSVSTEVAATVTQTAGGVIVQVDAFGYPSPSFSIAPR